MSYILLILLIFMSGCGPLELPQRVKIDPDDAVLLSLPANRAVNWLNSYFGDVFTITDGDADIKIKCSNKLNGQVTGHASGQVGDITIKIRCGWLWGLDYKNIAHELWHALGFWEHYDNKDCLNTEWSTTDFKRDLCPEMVEDFNLTYGDEAYEH